jgi:ankyrin repeat protein
MAQWRFAVPALMLASLVARAASPLQPDDRLAEAARRGDRVAVQTLLRTRVPVDSAEGDGSTALHWAAYQDNLAVAEELLNAHASVNAVTRVQALTPLMMACQSGSAPMAELLLKHGADVNQANSLGTTPLMMASASGSAAAVKMLLDHGADANVREHVHEQTALMFAANMDRAEVIRVLLVHGADANAASKVMPVPKISFRPANAVVAPVAKGKDTKGKESFEVGAGADGEKSVKDIPAAKSKSGEKVASADAKAMPGDASDTADADGKKAAADPVVRMFRENGAKQMGGMTPLLYAARQGNIAAATALLDGGAKINEVSGAEHTTPLVLAIANGHLDLAKVLVEHGADVNLANDQGVTPLWATVDVQWPPHEWSPEPLVDQEKTDYLTLMKILLAHGENPNARLGKQVWERVMSENRNWIDPAGATAFWRAAQAEDVKAMRLLKDAGADPSIPSKMGSTPLMVAAGLGWSANYSTTSPTQMEAVQYCMSLGADVNAHDDMGYTPLHGAAFVGDLQIIHYLVDHGAKTDVKTKAGDTVADLANGPFEKSLPNPDAVALLEKLGSGNSHNCRSSDCVPPVKEDKPAVATATVEAKKPAVATAIIENKKPATDK